MKRKTINLIYPACLTAILLLLLALTGCRDFFGINDKECPDIISHELTDTEKAMLYYQQGDSVFFKDKTGGEIYYLYCTSKETGKDGIYHEDYHCENDGYKEEWDIIKVQFESNFPYSHNTKAELYILLETVGQESSRLRIRFHNQSAPIESYNYYIYDLGFYNNEFHYIRKVYFIQYDSLLINNEIFKDVSKIYYENEFGTDQEIYYDTLYINIRGLLRFVSSKYDHDLELME